MFALPLNVGESLCRSRSWLAAGEALLARWTLLVLGSLRARDVACAC